MESLSHPRRIPSSQLYEIYKMSPSKTTSDDEALAKELVASYEKIKDQVHKVIVGQEKVLEQLLIAMLARGHCLLEGVPGLAKTLMIRSLAQAIDLSFRRIQFTLTLCQQI